MSTNVSDEEQQQQMEKIFICADVWHGVFAFLCPFDVGLKMALISDRLDVLVDVHFKSRKWSLGSMEIDRAIGGNGAGIRNKRSREPQLPIPQEPIPTKVIGFERIIIGYIDQSVIEFLQRFRCLFNSSGTNVYIARNLCDRSRRGEIIHQKIWPLVNDNICGFRLYFSDLDDLRQFSPTILRNCANLRSIDTVGFSPEFPADDNADASSEQALTKWLFTSRGDGLPKMLYCWLSSAEKLKRSFVNALESANFIIRLRSFSGIEPFELTNNLTGERLTLRRINEDKWLLVRCPIGQEDKWAEWEDEANGWECYYQWNLIIVCFNNSDTGDGMIGANEGPMEPNE